MDIVLRALVVFIAVFFFTRVIGRRELSTLQPFDLILLIERNMRRERIDISDLAEKARLSGIGAFENIRWAVLETNGEISFIKNDRD